MRFARRSSSLAPESVQTESEPRRRNRLSKPLTGNAIKISASTSALSLQVPTQSNNTSTTELAAVSPLSPTSGNVSRLKVRNEVLRPDDDSDNDNDNESPNHALKNDSSWTVAYRVSQFEDKVPEATPNQQELQQQLAPPLSPARPPRPQKRKSFLLRRLSSQRSSSLIRTTSNERINLEESAMAAGNSPSTSLDQLMEIPPIPTTRRSSFIPGAATRKLSPANKRQEIQDHKVIVEAEESEACHVGPDYLYWQPPPPTMTGRAGTPSDMGYSQLGGLKHGSLQVVNGRASPTLSVASKMSKHLLAVQTAHIDVSSEYGDADEEVEHLFIGGGALGRTNIQEAPALRRLSSWEKDDDNTTPRFHPLQNVMSPQENTESMLPKDQTSLMAKEYIAELVGNPFEQQEPNSPVGTIRRTRSEGSLWRASSCSSLQRSPSVEEELSQICPVSPVERSPSPSGSVIRKSSDGSSRGRSREVLQEIMNGEEMRPRDSAMSWYSRCDPSYQIDEAFQSAAEFQVHLSPADSGLRLQASQALEKSDSGYSSSNSLRSLQMSKRTPPPKEIEALPEVPDANTSKPAPEPSRAASFLGPRPSILKSRKTEPNVPTFSTLRQSVKSSKSGPVVLTPATIESGPAATKPAKARQKLMKKRRPLSQPPGQVAIVRARSFEEDNIPQVSSEAREKLRMRSQAVPELEQTYVALHSKASSSNLDLPNIELRFPSPTPEQPKRSRSRSRPRSWFGRTKSEVSISRDDSGISKAEAIAIIHHFSTGDAALGRSPYDSRDHGHSSRPSKGKSVLSKGPSRARSMMDDETAAELSRLRSRASQERDGMIVDRRSSFNDRGGVPGKKLRPASLASDAPPITPEMLEKAYRTSSMQQQSSMSTGVAPPPPPHSLRPSYVDHAEDNSGPVLPPPPSNSPRPVGVTQDPWAAQAAAWKARRRSLGETLRRQPEDSRSHRQHHEDVECNALYPTIPRHSQQQPNWQQCLSPEDYSHRPYESYTGHNGSMMQPQSNYAQNRGSYELPTEHESAYIRQSRQNSMAHDTQCPRGRAPVPSREPPWHHQLPSPGPSGGSKPTSRRQSQANSVRSIASSLAEELHPPNLERSHPPPAFGRYSGGMDYGYERGNGFGGSAGTRSNSGKAQASRKGVDLRASFGVDLGDVPIGIMAS